MMLLEGGRLRSDLAEHLPDYQFAFEGSSEEGYGTYYHTARTRQLSARFGDMLHKIQDLEVRGREGRDRPPLRGLEAVPEDLSSRPGAGPSQVVLQGGWAAQRARLQCGACMLRKIPRGRR
jgi:hypothetical protein